MLFRFSNNLITRASNMKNASLSGCMLRRQREDEVEHQHLGSILAQNHHEGEDIPRATHQFGGTATHLIVNGLILHMIEIDHTPHMTEDDRTHPMTGADHIHHMTGGTAQGLRTGTAQGLHTATAQGLHTATEDRDHVLMTGLHRHTTEGATVDRSPGHQVPLRGLEGGAILAVPHLRIARLRAVPRCQKDQRAILQRKGIVRGNGHAAGLPARGVVQGKATHTAVVLTHGLSLGSAQLELVYVPT